jgi:hypothetical protein
MSRLLACHTPDWFVHPTEIILHVTSLGNLLGRRGNVLLYRHGGQHGALLLRLLLIARGPWRIAVALLVLVCVDMPG